MWILQFLWEIEDHLYFSLLIMYLCANRIEMYKYKRRRCVSSPLNPLWSDNPWLSWKGISAEHHPINTRSTIRPAFLLSCHLPFIVPRHPFLSLLLRCCLVPKASPSLTFHIIPLISHLTLSSCGFRFPLPPFTYTHANLHEHAHISVVLCLRCSGFTPASRSTKSSSYVPVTLICDRLSWQKSAQSAAKPKLFSHCFNAKSLG